MTVRAHNSNVVLFPLCDKSGVMLQALQPECPGSTDIRWRRPGTRPDAIVFAWVLDLPTQIDSVDAARAVLDATRHQLHQYNPYQRSVVAELAKLIEQETAGRGLMGSKQAKGKVSNYRQRKKGFFSRHARVVPNGEQRNFVCLSGGLERGDNSTSES